jgi:hypothetical protein
LATPYCNSALVMLEIATSPSFKPSKCLNTCGGRRLMMSMQVFVSSR